MPRRVKKLSTKSEQNANRLSTRSDFTVYDYAHNIGNKVNATTPRCKTQSTAFSGRLQKAATNAWRTEVKEMRGQSVMHCQPQLTSTDNADDAADVDDELDETVIEDSLVPVQPLPVSEQRQGGKKTRLRTVGGDGVVYPIDLWFLIGSYIAPEDVSRFARICRDTHFVAHSARFWLSLYHRFCHSSESLPASLQPSAVEHRPHGLRTRVIRSLFHVYLPLSERVLSRSTSSTSSQVDPQQLIGLRCILAWQERSAKPNWKFYFKFRRGLGKLRCPLSVGSANRDCGTAPRLLAPADVLHNLDERCVILVVTTPHFLPLPVVMGHVLARASVTGCVCTQSLRLIFSSEYVHPSRSDISSSVVAHFNPFISACILHWWHPYYPHRR